MHEDLVSDKWHAALFIKKEAKASISKRTKREREIKARKKCYLSILHLEQY
jgi:hypothetical protein